MSDKRLTRREFLRVAGLTGVGWVAAACAPTVPATVAPGATSAPTVASGPRSGGVLRLAVGIDSPTLYVPEVTAQQARVIMGTCLESLGKYDASGKLLPWLATSFKEDADAKTITLTLRTGVKFHDGTDMDAAAVKWAIDRFLEAKRSEFANVKSADVVDNSTVRVNLSTWDNTVTNVLGEFIMPISPTAFQKNGGKDWAARNPVGTGPFQLVSWTRDAKQVYKKFDGYWQKGKPYLDGVEWSIIADPTVAQAALVKKEVDAWISLPSLNAKDLEKQGLQVLNLTTGLGALIYGIIGNSANPNSPFAKVQVRQAVSYAIDNQAILDTLAYSYGVVVNQWATPMAWSYNPNVKGYPYNPDKAKQLLAEAGFPNGFKTKYTCQSDASAQQFATAYQGMLSKIGIDAQLEPLDFAKYNEYTTGGKFEALISWSGRGDADVAFVMPRNLSAGGVLYAKGMAHPDDIEKLLADVKSARDFETKKSTAMQLQQTVYDKYAMMTPVYIAGPLVARYPKLHDDGLNKTHGTQWTPADAWMEA